jgi:hypothetical protein
MSSVNVASSQDVTLDVEQINTNTDELEAKADISNTHLSAIQAAVEILDNAVSGTELQVDVVTSGLPTGASTEATLATKASESTLSTRASESTLSTRASETTLATRASETTLATRASEDKQDLQIKRAFGGTAASDVYLLASVGAKTFTFHGIQVIDAITLTSVTDTNLTGDSLSGKVLTAGYHPIAGTAIDCSAVGLAYLIGA